MDPSIWVSNSSCTLPRGPLGFGPVWFLMDTYKWTYIGGTSPHLVTIHPNFLAPTSKLLLKRCFPFQHSSYQDERRCQLQCPTCLGNHWQLWWLEQLRFWWCWCFWWSWGSTDEPKKTWPTQGGESKNDGNFLRCSFYYPRRFHVGVSKNKGTPKWMVKIMENPIKMDDVWVPLFSETLMYCIFTYMLRWNMATWTRGHVGNYSLNGAFGCIWVMMFEGDIPLQAPTKNKNAILLDSMLQNKYLRKKKRRIPIDQ